MKKRQCTPRYRVSPHEAHQIAADARLRAAAAAAVVDPTRTLALRGDRLLQFTEAPGEIILTSGFVIARAATPAMIASGKVRIPLSKIAAVQRLLGAFHKRKR